MGRKFSPSSGLLVLGFLQDSFSFNQLLSELDEQLHDSLNGFVIDFGCQFSQGGDDWLEQGTMSLIFGKALLDSLKSWLQLSERSSESQVLNELDCIIDSGNGLIMLTIFPFPDSVLGISVCFLRCVGFLVSLNVLNSLSNVVFSFGKGIGVVVSHLGVSSYLSFVVVDGVVQIIKDSIASADISSSNFIMLLLIFVQASNDFVQEHVNFVS